MHNSIFSIPVSRERQTSMRLRLIIFSSILFLLIFLLGSSTFIILMKQILIKNTGNELMQAIETERLKLEASVNSEIAIALKMAGSPLIQRYFLNPTDSDLKKIALEEIAGYRRAFASNTVFWVNDIDKEFYFDEGDHYTVDTKSPENYWYRKTLYETEKFNFNINYNPAMKKIMLWINAPVFNAHHRPIGLVGTGIALSDFVDAMYRNYSGIADLYFFNATGEIAGANDVSLVENKVTITDTLGQTGAEIFAAAKELRPGGVKCFETKDKGRIAAIASIPALGWYITTVHSFTIGDSLHAGMTALFGIMMAVIFSVFVTFNIFIAVMLEPLNQMVKTLNQTLSDWELEPHEEVHHKNEIGTLGEFLNMTVIDQLTGIYNRRYLDGQLKAIIKSYSRTESYLSVLMIDIDYFKKYNDTYGHDAGDNCLKAIAAALARRVIRDDDFVARYGGEEFVVILPNTDKNGAQLVADSLLQEVRDCNIPHKANDVADCVTISIGVTTGIVKHFQQESDYIKCADKALYESKTNGRNRYTFEDFEGGKSPHWTSQD